MLFGSNPAFLRDCAKQENGYVAGANCFVRAGAKKQSAGAGGQPARNGLGQGF
jgi:hypothetical protein